MDAAASFWREWIINYDAGHQRTLSKSAATSGRQFLEEARKWIERQHESLLQSARRTHDRFINFPQRFLAWVAGVAALLITLLNLRRVLRGIRELALRAHPERAPREAAALWYERMVVRMARLGWRKSPSQTPMDFVAQIQEADLQTKVATFTRAYESARFGKSIEDARRLAHLLRNINPAEPANISARNGG